MRIKAKLDQLHGLIGYHDIKLEPAALKRAEKTIKAVNRKPKRKNLAYFFGILKRIQQERDDEAYRRYCYHRYNQQQMLQSQRQQQKYQQSSISVVAVVEMLVKAVKANVQFAKDLAIRKARQWARELMESYRYMGTLKK